MYSYLLPFVIFWLAGGFLWYHFGYNESFLLLNRHYFELGDAFFPHFTHLADGVLLSCLFGFFVIKRDKPLILTMIIGLLLVAQVISYLKYRVFMGYNRPFIVLGEQVIHYVTIEGEKYASFPSGHSAAAAAMGFFFAFFHRNDKKWIGFLWAILMI
ncbi:MAG: phosphatase PAP2 family protein, partial [Bacteroidia bacterium]